MYYIPTKEDCDKIVENNDTFMKKEEVINGLNVVQYNYLLASYSDFVDPIKDGSMRAEELRGITFVDVPNYGWKRTLMLHKFYRIDQTIGSMYDDVKDMEILSVEDKVDGSIITFVEIGGKVYAKSKFSFQSEQATEAQRIYDENEKIQEFVDLCFRFNLSPIFEYVSPSNQVVVLYPESKLVLLQVRNNYTGEYASLGVTAEMYGIEKAASFPVKPLDDILAEMETMTNKEGYIIKFPTMFMKVKCKWYDSLHSLVTSDGTCSRTDHLIQATLDEVIDDLLAQIPMEFDKVRERVIEVNDKVVHYVNKVVNNVTLFLEIDGGLSRKDFAIKYKSNRFFSVMMRHYGGDTSVDAVYKSVKDFVLKNCRTMEMAEKFYTDVICGE